MKIILFLLFGFIYADCNEIDNETDCLSLDYCEWHADEGMCEDEEHDDHDHEHCDELNEDECSASDHCEWHADEGMCEDEGHEDHEDEDHHEDHGNSFELTGLSSGSTTFSLLIMHEGHADFTSLPILVNVDEEIHCDELNEDECSASDHCEWHADEGMCEDEGHDDHDHGDCDSEAHLNVDGLILEYNGDEIYSQFQGLINGSLDLHVNDSMDLTVHFLDQNGDEIEGQDSECYPLGFQITDPTIISITVGEHEEHEDEDSHDDHDHDEDEHCDEIDSQTECENSEHCEWHADEGM